MPTETRAKLFRRTALPLLTVDFFLVADSPVNLAVFRIFLFGAILLHQDLRNSVWYSTLPKQLIFPPHGLEHILPFIPINAGIDSIATSLLEIACTTAMIGLRARTSAMVATLLAFYVLGVPQLYGKVTHTSPCLLWFAAILAISRCADVLSVDALINARAKADQNIVEAPAPSAQYGAPLRMVWLIMGSCIYFFPGFWKAVNCGQAYLSTNVPALIMRREWVIYYPQWLPPLPLDQLPALCHIASALTISFELLFIVLIFFPVGRILLFCAGELFHTLCNLMIHIDFTVLQACYVVLLNWDAIFRRFGNIFFPQELILVYEPSQARVRRLIASLMVFDVLGRITYVPTGQKYHPHADDKIIHIPAPDASSTLPDYGALLQRIPICWMLLPAYSLPGLKRAVEQLIQSAFDQSVSQDEPNRSTAPSTGNETTGSPLLQPRAELLPLVIVTGLIIGANASFNLRRDTAGWPFTCYPLFDDRTVSETVSTITIAAIDPSRPSTINPRLQCRENRWQGLASCLLATNTIDRCQRLKALWEYMRSQDSSLKNVTRVCFYKDVLSTNPEQRDKNPIRRELLLELNEKPN